jgi:hypothetical protein
MSSQKLQSFKGILTSNNAFHAFFRYYLSPFFEPLEGSALSNGVYAELPSLNSEPCFTIVY